MIMKLVSTGIGFAFCITLFIVCIIELRYYMTEWLNTDKEDGSLFSKTLSDVIGSTITLSAAIFSLLLMLHTLGLF